MALQQYNFFPTDFFYPRPQPSSPPTLETSSANPKPKAVPLQTPKRENQNQQHMIKVYPPTHALVCNPSLTDKKLFKLSTKPLSLAEQESDAF
ncbi:hypothetical protein SESBI_17850 [Sesbania bispinosa]|nr:hypothetical protein SESBI_17850 [Sesbania bispinosa]